MSNEIVKDILQVSDLETYVEFQDLAIALEYQGASLSKSNAF